MNSLAFGLRSTANGRRSERTGDRTGDRTRTDLAVADQPRWLRDVRLRAARRVLFVRHCWSQSPYADEQLLAISHSEVDRALAPAGVVRAQAAELNRTDPAAAELTRAIDTLADVPEDARWLHLTTTLQIEPADRCLLALAVAAAVDAPFRRVLGYLGDGIAASGATPSLVADLFDGGEGLGPGPDSAALAWQLLAPAAGAHQPSSSTVFEPDPAIVRALVSGSGSDWSTGCAGRRLTPPADEGIRPAQARELADFIVGVRAGSGQVVPIELELHGPLGSGRRTLAARIAATLGLPLVVVALDDLAADEQPERRLIAEARRAVLEQAALALVAGEEDHPAAHDPRSAAALARCPLVFTCTDSVTRTPAVRDAVRRSVAVTPLHRRERLALWSLLGHGPAPAPVAEWALRPGEIAAAARVAPAGEAAVADVTRRLLGAGTDALCTSLPLPFTWDDLVLASDREAHLRELEAQARDRSVVLDEWGFRRLTPMGRGTTALFAGPSGTGKTMAAQVLARSLGLECVRVDLAGVVSKYIGETEKQLRRLFDACERSPTLLLFDEADALFGKRTQVSDAHDRYANIEIDYLLQQMERFDGLAVLATNRKGDLDTAFVRRLRFIVQFAPPSTAERERLWRRNLEGAHDLDGWPLVGELDYGTLATEFDLTAADIKSAALAAAHLAFSERSAIELRHVLAAGRRELEKQGQVVRAGRREDAAG